jgi:hypothetical protein
MVDINDNNQYSNIIILGTRVELRIYVGLLDLNLDVEDLGHFPLFLLMKVT